MPPCYCSASSGSWRTVDAAHEPHSGLAVAAQGYDHFDQVAGRGHLWREGWQPFAHHQGAQALRYPS